jgi:hypothetical protein
MSYSGTSYSAVELCLAETTASASQLEAHLQAAVVELFQENNDIIEESVFQIVDRG